MHHLPRFFSQRKQNKGMYPNNKSTNLQRKPRLDRRNAVKHVDYDAVSSPSSLDTSCGSLHTRSSHSTDLSSFRVNGTDGEIDQICRDLGFSGPDDFSIPEAAWQAMKAKSSSEITPISKNNEELEDQSGKVNHLGHEFEIDDSVTVSVRCLTESTKVSCCNSANSGIRGIRPPMLKPPPGTRNTMLIDSTCSTWDILRDLAPQVGGQSLELREVKKEEVGIERKGSVREEEDVNARRIGEIVAQFSASCSFTTSNEDDSSSTFTDPPSNNISPNVRFKRSIMNWEKGELLGRGSFGSVFEGISE